MIRNKYLGVLAGTIILVANLPGCGGGEALRATSNPDGSRFTDDQIWERELERGQLGFAMDRKMKVEMTDQYGEIVPKKYVTAFHRLPKEPSGTLQVAMAESAGLGIGDALDYVNIGMHLTGGTVLGPAWLSIFDGSNSGAKRSIIKQSLRDVNQPYLGIFRFPALDGETPVGTSFPDDMDRIFLEMDALARGGIHLECDASDHWKGNKAWTANVPGLSHSRWYFCDPNRPAPVDWRVRADVFLIVHKVGYRSALQEMVAPGDLVATLTVNGLRNLPGWKDDHAAQRLYGQIRDRIDPNWYTVFTGPDDSGDWKVFVAKGDKIMAFDPPPKS